MAQAARDSVVALTGATGFVGRHLAQGLTEAGYPVRALTRKVSPPPTRASPPKGPSEKIEWVTGSLSDRSSLSRLVAGAAAVVHCAGAVRGGSRASFAETNVAGTGRLVEEAAKQPKQPRFLLISSLAAREPQLSWYASTKLEGERMLEERSHGMAWTVFRPTALYGPGDREMRPLFQAMRRGILPVVGAPGSRITLLHVSDFARAVVRWMARPLEESRVFELHDGTEDGYGWQQIAAIAEDAWNRPVRSVRIPPSVLGFVAWLNLGLGRAVGNEPMLTPGKVRELRHPSWVCDNTTARSVLSWTPEIDLATALRTNRAFA